MSAVVAEARWLFASGALGPSNLRMNPTAVNSCDSMRATSRRGLCAFR